MTGLNLDMLCWLTLCNTHDLVIKDPASENEYSVEEW